MISAALLNIANLVPIAFMFGGGRPLALQERQIDAGTFAITLAGRRAGQETFQIVDVGQGRSLEVRTRSTLTLPLGATTIRGTLRVDPSWRPRGGTFETTARGQTLRVTLQARGDSLEAITKLPGRPTVSLTRPPRAPDLYFGTNMLAHLTPLCREAAPKEKTLTVFPAAPLKISPLTMRKYPLTKLGAPALELTDVVADLARSMRIEVVCEGARLVAVRQYNQRLIAVRASYEDLASTMEAQSRGKPLLPQTVVELPRKVRAGDGGATLGCTLLVPATHAQMKRGRKPVAATVAAPGPGGLSFTPEAPTPLPGVVLMGGFGAQDRDGNSVGPGDFHLFFLAVLAGKLAEAGVASLRCDDRGAGQSSGDLKRATLETLTGDARAELAALRAEPAIDPARTGLLGHSEGAIIASMLARRDGKTRALVLLAPPARPLDTLILEQEQGGMRRFGLGEEEIAAALAELRQTYDAVRDGKRLPASLSPAERRGVQESSAWLRSHFRHRPLAEAPELKGLPVFIAQGAKDVQISKQDAELTRDAFLAGGNRGVVFKIYPELNHLFAVSKNWSVADYYDPLAEVDGTFLKDVAIFLSTSLAPPAVAGPAAR